MSQFGEVRLELRDVPPEVLLKMHRESPDGKWKDAIGLALWEPHEKRCLAYIHGRVHSASDAEELLLEVFRKFLVALDNPEVVPDYGLVGGMARWACIDHRNQMILSEDALDRTGLVDVDTLPELPDEDDNAHTKDPMQLLEEAQEAEATRMQAEEFLANQLPSRRDRGIYLAAAEGRSYEDIANQLQVTEATVANVLHKARTRVRGALETAPLPTPQPVPVRPAEATVRAMGQAAKELAQVEGDEVSRNLYLMRAKGAKMAQLMEASGLREEQVRDRIRETHDKVRSALRHAKLLD